ncbi:MAG: alpha/beta fold hydrolase [Gammaproteobacteria bacterium]|nr:alpha/beta fold hydrolase [Gammaproteobacteria bacterium]
MRQLVGILFICLLSLLATTAHAGKALPAMRAVEIKSQGLTLSARFYPAERATGAPAVLLLHGWNWPQNDPSAGVVNAARDFQAAGYAVLTPSMRGWPPSGGIDDCAGRQVDDALVLLEWLGRQPGIDGSRRYLAGFSQGGQVALLAASRAAPVRAVAAFAPVVDPGSWGEETRVDGIRDYVMEECGGEEGWPSRSAMHRADSLQQPLLLVHGDADLRVPTQQSVRLYQKLVELQRPVRLQLIPAAAHDQDAVLQPQLAIDFFRSVTAKDQPHQ